MKQNIFLRTLFLALLLLSGSTIRAAVVDTLAVYSEGMKKNVPVVVITPDKPAEACPTGAIAYTGEKTSTEVKNEQ